MEDIELDSEITALKNGSRVSVKQNTLKYQSFKAFCNQTSLHGWNYICHQNSSKVDKIFWTLIILLSASTAAYFLSKSTIDYQRSTVRNNFNIFQFIGF